MSMLLLLFMLLGSAVSLCLSVWVAIWIYKQYKNGTWANQVAKTLDDIDSRRKK